MAALLGGSLLVTPAAAAAAPSEPAATPDRLVTTAQAKGRTAFRFEPGSGDHKAPYTFVSTGGTVTAQPLGDRLRKPVQARSGAPAKAGARVNAAAATYRTTLTIDTENWSAAGSLWNVWNRDTWTYVSHDGPMGSQTLTLDLPPGNYYATAMYGIYNVDSYLLTKAFTVTGAAQTVRLAESSAREVALSADDATARSDGAAVWMSLPNGDLVGFAGGYQNTRTYVTTASTAGTTLRAHQILVKSGSSSTSPTPYRYDLTRSWPHPLPASPTATIATSSLARTTTTIRAPGTIGDGFYQTVPSTGEWTGAYLATRMRLPATFTEYVTPGLVMSGLVSYPYSSQSLSLGDRTLQSGANPGITAGAGPLMPGRRPWDDGSERAGNRLTILENMTMGDTAGHPGADTSAGTAITLRSGGDVIGTSETVSLSAIVPQASQTYELEQTTTRPPVWSQLSTKTTSVWTFTSEFQPVAMPLPLIDLAVTSTGLDQRNRAGAEPVRLTVTPSTREFDAAETVDRAEWSADDGKTWTEVPVTAAGEIAISVPATATFVSLRLAASNDVGGKLTRTMLRAFAGPATPGEESAGDTTISAVRVNAGAGLAIGVGGAASIPVSFTASDPSGIKEAGLRLWHGNYLTADGVEPTWVECLPVSDTTVNCTGSVEIPDVHWTFGSNALAGTWQAGVWATAKDGSFRDRPNAGSMVIRRNSALTADATPEPARLGSTITVTGTLLRANWETATYQPYASQSVQLQRARSGTYDYLLVGSIRTDTAGVAKGYPAAGYDASYRFYWPGDASSSPVYSAGDFVDVQ